MSPPEDPSPVTPKGSIWEDGLGHGDAGAEVVDEARTAHHPDPQSLRYGVGECEVVVQAVRAGPAFRSRPVVDVLWHEGLRPSYMRLTPAEAREIGQMLTTAAERAERIDT